MPLKSSYTRQEDAIALLAKLGGWIHIMTGSAYEQRNTQSCKAKRKKGFWRLSQVQAKLFSVSPLPLLGQDVSHICSTFYWLIFLFLIRSLLKQKFSLWKQLPALLYLAKVNYFSKICLNFSAVGLWRLHDRPDNHSERGIWSAPYMNQEVCSLGGWWISDERAE